ncbi:ECF subfamily RNA polymerase sigma-24 factor [Roseibium sp. TrichSKD4]|nr:ECF subfamily RNA polymerase sigma-24 factor [Roseibium sp. TrichSKD4]
MEQDWRVKSLMSKSRVAQSQFEKMRPQLMGLAYRMLGTVADAEDAVQDTFLKWQAQDIAQINNAEAWLTRVCANHCLDILKSAHKTRLDYDGPWISEPLQTLTTAFLMVMERLTPKERAAYLLREVFGNSYGEVADVLQIGEPACRQLVSRAKRNVQSAAPRCAPAPKEQEQFLHAFLAAVETGSVENMQQLLSASVRYRTDGGGKATALTRSLDGAEQVAKYIVRILGRLWDQNQTRFVELNGVRSLVVFECGEAHTAMSFGFDAAGKVADVFVSRNPDKLGHLSLIYTHDLKNGGALARGLFCFEFAVKVYS